MDLGVSGITALVVLGAPHSGTTLMATAIGAHRAVAMLYEEYTGAMFNVIGGKIPAVKLCTPLQVDLDRRWRGYYDAVLWNGWMRKRIGYRLPRSRLSLRDMSRRAKLKIVCMLRDPVNNIASLRRREGRSDVLTHDMLRRTYRLYRQLLDEPLIDTRMVSFEQFVLAPEEKLRGLCQWAGLDYDPQMLTAPRLNPLYPEGGFRRDKAASSRDADSRHDGLELRELWSDHRALLARAL